MKASFRREKSKPFVPLYTQSYQNAYIGSYVSMNHYDPHMYDFKIHIIHVHVQWFSGVRLFSTLLTVARQAPLSKGLSSQEYWSGLPFPPPGDLPDPGIKPRSPALQADILPSEPPRKPLQLSSQPSFSLKNGLDWTVMM